MNGSYHMPYHAHVMVWYGRMVCAVQGGGQVAACIMPAKVCFQWQVTVLPVLVWYGMILLR